MFFIIQQVYQRADLNKILMSMSIGAFCHIKQEVSSSNAQSGSQVSLVLTEYERENGMFLNIFIEYKLKFVLI